MCRSIQRPLLLSSFLQLLSLSTIYVFTTKVGIDMMTPTVIIGALADKQNVGAGPLSDVTEEQTSWIGEKNLSCPLKLFVYNRVTGVSPRLHIYVVYSNNILYSKQNLNRRKDGSFRGEPHRWTGDRLVFLVAQ